MDQGNISKLERRTDMYLSTLRSYVEAMGGARERLRCAAADDFALDGIDKLNLVALELTAATGARVIPMAPGLPDAWFEHDGQITKQDIRAMTLAGGPTNTRPARWQV